MYSISANCITCKLYNVMQRAFQSVYICVVDMYYNFIDKYEIILYTYKTNLKTNHKTNLKTNGINKPRLLSENANDWTELHILRKLCMIYILDLYKRHTFKLYS